MKKEELKQECHYWRDKAEKEEEVKQEAFGIIREQREEIEHLKYEIEEMKKLRDHTESFYKAHTKRLEEDKL